MVSAQLSHLLWNSLQCVACSTSLPVYGTFAKHVQMKNRNVINRKKKNRKKKSNNLKWPHSGEFLIPWSFSNSNRKICQFCAVAKLAISKQVSQKHSCMVLCIENYNSYSNQQPASKYYLLPVCPSWPSFFSIFRFNFTNKTRICWKSHYILHLQGYCIQVFSSISKETAEWQLFSVKVF